MSLPDTSIERLEEMKQHYLWKSLTEQQKAFCEHFVTSGFKDRYESVRAVYNVRTQNGARAVSSRLLRKYEIRRLLSEFYGYERGNAEMSKMELLSMISRRIRLASESGNARELNRLIDMYTELQGWRRSTNVKPVIDQEEEPAATQEDDFLTLVQQYEWELYEEGKEEQSRND